MSEGVRPALIDWRRRLVWRGSAGTEFMVLMDDGLRVPAMDFRDDPVAVISPADALPAAALLLQRAGPDGKPLFTREHWVALMLAADGSYLNEERKALAVEAVARLASVLPPEEPE